jgi:hypothetical protein
LGEKVVTLDNSTAPVCLWAGNVHNCSIAPQNLLPIECVGGTCVIADSRNYVVYPDAVKFSFVGAIEPKLMFPWSATVSANGIPIGASFAVGPAFGWTLPITIEFTGTSRQFGNVTIADPVRLSFPDTFAFTVDRLAMDFRSFKRHFRDVGAFADGKILKVTKQIALTEGHYYTEVVLGQNGWQLIGNENAWNTTLDLGTINLAIETEISDFRISAVGSVLREGFSLTMASSPAKVIIDPSVLLITEFQSRFIAIDASTFASVEHNFRVMPPFIITGHQVDLIYRPLENTIRHCVYSSSSSECTDPWDTSSGAGSEFVIPPAGRAIFELRGSGRAVLINTSAETIQIDGNGYPLTVSAVAGREATREVDLTVVNAPLEFDGRPTVVLNSLKADYRSLSSATANFEIGSALVVSGHEAPSSAQTGKPNFALAEGATLTMTNAHFLPSAEMTGKSGLNIGNGHTTWGLSGLTAGMQLYYGQGDVEISNSGGPTDAEFVLPVDGTSLRVKKGWVVSRDLPTVTTNGSTLSLTLDEDAEFFYTDNSKLTVTPATLGHMSFDSIFNAEVTVSSSIGIREIIASDIVVSVSNLAVIDRRRFVGRLLIRHDDTSGELRLVLGESEGVPANFAFDLRPDSILRLDPAWSEIDSPTHIELNGSRATVFYEGSSMPVVFDVIGSDIRMLPVSDYDDSSSGVSKTTISVVVVAVIGAVAVAIGLYMFVTRKRVMLIAEDYDKFTDAPSDTESMFSDL